MRSFENERSTKYTESFRSGDLCVFVLRKPHSKTSYCLLRRSALDVRLRSVSLAVGRKSCRLGGVDGKHFCLKKSYYEIIADGEKLVMFKSV